MPRRRIVRRLGRRRWRPAAVRHGLARALNRRSARILSVIRPFAGRASLGVAPHWPVTAGGWAAMLAIALVSTVAAMLAFFAGLERLGAARTSMP